MAHQIADRRESELQERLEDLRRRAPAPVFWLFGKTQSGKTSIIRYLTGAEDAEIGKGFQPCTRFSREYQFPSADAPLLFFIDTRGLDEPGYDPGEDLMRFHEQAHVVVVTVKVLDQALENVVRHLRTLRRDSPTRPVVLVLTCLHEAYPQAQHVEPYPFGKGVTIGENVPPDLARAIAAQRQRFAGLVDDVVLLDLTPDAEGFDDPEYGGPRLKESLLEALPAAYRQTLIHLSESTTELQDLFARRAHPYVLGYSTLAATAGAFPIPWLDLFVMAGIQARMIHQLGNLYGQALNVRRFLDLVGPIALGLMMKQATREALKVIPFLGSVVGATFAGAATFALGKACCYYFSRVHKGHVPRAEDLRKYFDRQLAEAQAQWSTHGRSQAPR